MHQYQERDGERDGKPGGKTRVKEIRKVCEEDILDRAKWKNDIHNFITIPTTQDDG